MNNKINNKMNNKKVKKVLALTLGLGLAVGSLTMGTSTIVHANEKPAEIQNMQTNNEKPAEIQNVQTNNEKPINDTQNSQNVNNKQNLQELLKLLKTDEATFAQEQTSGKSIVEIAATHNVSRQAVVDLVVKQMNRQIKQGLADKTITKAQATQMKTTVTEEAQKVVDGQPSSDAKQNSQDVNNKQNLQEMLTLLKIDEATFAQEQTSGKSLAEIAAAHNVSRQDVVDLIVKNMNRQIDQGLAEKSITVEQANGMKTTAIEKAQKVVDEKTIEQPVTPQK